MAVDTRKTEKKYFYESYSSTYDEMPNFYDLGAAAFNIFRSALLVHVAGRGEDDAHPTSRTGRQYRRSGR